MCLCDIQQQLIHWIVCHHSYKLPPHLWWGLNLFSVSAPVKYKQWKVTLACCRQTYQGPHQAKKTCSMPGHRDYSIFAYLKKGGIENGWLRVTCFWMISMSSKYPLNVCVYISMNHWTHCNQSVLSPILDALPNTGQVAAQPAPLSLTVSCCDPGRACQLLQHKIAKHLVFPNFLLQYWTSAAWITTWHSLIKWSRPRYY